jgi:primosomal protein N'
MKRFVETTRQERETFAYPPSKRVVKIIIRGDETAAESWRTLVSRSLPKSWSLHWRGPMPIEHQSATRGTRTILHAVLPPSITENDLINAFTPWAEKVGIDLDPIAFLR